MGKLSVPDVTAVVLTFNEELNIGRTLDSLRTFPRVVVLDSGSTDRTEEIARAYPNVSWSVNRFEGHVRQWRWALERTGIESAFVLALDADMSVSTELTKEISEVTARGDLDAGSLRVEYRILGVPLLGSLYPPELRLLRLSNASVREAGHTQKFSTTGKTVSLEHPLLHDDRKPLEAFVRAQLGYSEKELHRILAAGGGTLDFNTRLRRSFPFTPILVWLLAWLRAGGPLRGPAARRYAMERLVYEAMLRWRLEDQCLRRSMTDGKGAD